MIQDQFSIVAMMEIRPYVVVHEFGHLLGLYHEHENRDSNEDPNCRIAYKNGVPIRLPYSHVGKSNGPLPSAIIETPYDPESVMNDCNLARWSSNASKSKQIKVLSELDRKTLKRMYSSEGDPK